jgi:hypothetical protein
MNAIKPNIFMGSGIRCSWDLEGEQVTSESFSFDYIDS